MHHLLFLLILFPTITESFSLFGHHSHHHDERPTGDECCISSKLNVAAKKANNGQHFFRRLSSEADSYKEVNPENMCNLIHFLIQQASLNNKSITLTKGMFVIFDSTKEIFPRLMKAKDEQESGDGAEHAGYANRLKHMTYQAFKKLFHKSDLEKSDTFIYVRGDESSHFHGERGSKSDRTHDYPAYGMDIPGACLPSGFGHILFGRLPSIESHGKYSGEPIYIKPELFGIQKLNQFIKHAKSYFDHVSRRYICQLKEMETKPGCSKEDAFRENTDKKLLDKWEKVLITIPSTSNNIEEYMYNAKKYGISEIDRQTKELKGEKVKEFRQEMIQQYGEDDLSVRKGREIIFTTNGLINSPLTCELLSKMKKC